MLSYQVKIGRVETPSAPATSRAVTASIPFSRATRSAAFTMSSF